MRHLTDVYLGAMIYKRITKGQEDTFYMLITDDDEELNYYAVNHLNRAAKIRGFREAKVICNEAIYNQVYKFVKGRFAIQTIKPRHINHLVSYYLLKFTANYQPVLQNMRMVSLQNSTTNLRMLLELGFFDKEYIMWSKMLFKDVYGEFIRTLPYKSELGGAD